MILSIDEVGLAPRRRSDRDRLIGHLDMQRVRSASEKTATSRYPSAARSYNPASDLAAVGNQDLLEHAASILANRTLCLCCVRAKMSTAAVN